VFGETSKLATGRIAAARGRHCRYFTMGHPSPWKSLILMGDLDPHIIHGSLGPSKSTTQAASRSVQPFLSGLRIVTDRPTDRTRYR